MFLWNWNDSRSFSKIGELAFSERAIENSREGSANRCVYFSPSTEECCPARLFSYTSHSVAPFE